MRQTRPVDEIIVVDNASIDGTWEMIERRFTPGVTYERLAENLGGAAGFDKGMRLAHRNGHDWIWCLDSDALPNKSALEDLLRAARAVPGEVAAVTCLFRNPATGKLYSGAGSHQRLSRGENASLPVKEGRVGQVDLAALICLLVRANAAERAGFLRRDLFIDLDDYFFSKELGALGKIIQVGGVVVDHCQRPTPLRERRGRRRLAAESFWRTYYATRNRLLYQKKYHGLWPMAARLAWRYCRALAGILMFDDYKRYRARLLTLSYLDGIRGRAGKRVDPQELQLWRRKQSAVL